MNLTAAWSPSEVDIARANVTGLRLALGLGSYAELHAWSVANREAFWALAIDRLGIRLRTPYSQLLDLAGGVESPRWLVGATLNITESCFVAPPDSPAIISQTEAGPLRVMSVRELDALSSRVANALGGLGFQVGDALAIAMPMTPEAVAIYLGILKAGLVVVSIADSFTPPEIATRLRIGQARAIFTQDVMIRGGKTIPLYERVLAAGAPRAIVFPAAANPRPGDLSWAEFLSEHDQFQPVAGAPHDPVNVLFSSGTTADPKAIPWTQTTPIKCATDACFHQDIHPGDVLVWPTNLGWMMGPWLIFASLINQATIGLYDGAPTGRGFARFVQDAKVTMLGVVPTLVKAWRTAGCVEGLDWGTIRVFSSTGECSSPDDMAWLMARAGGRPVIEYCGGTEIGGGYLTGTVVQPAVPGTFTTPALGLDLAIVDEADRAVDNGEVFLIPPSIGLSTALLNADHHAVYFAGTPRPGWRRHGDQIERLPNGLYRAHGRRDDTMKLGGIKVSSAEIERVLHAVPGVHEVAAIAVPAADGGPAQLVIYAVGEGREQLLADMQLAIKRDLNPLFKIHDLVLVDELPRTTSNKVLRRVLRDRSAPCVSPS